MLSRYNITVTYMQLRHAILLQMEPFVWLEELQSQKDVLKSATAMYGEQCVMISGAAMTLWLFADS